MEGQDNLSPKYIKVDVEVKIEATIREIIRIGIGQIMDQIVETEDNSGKTEVDTDLSKVIGEIDLEKIPRNYGRQNSRGEYRNNNYRNDSYHISRNKSRERSYSRGYDSNRTRSTSNSRSQSGSRASAHRDGGRCYRCRKYDDFARDCPTSREEREIEQLQCMLNLEEDQTSPLTNAQNGSEESPRVSPLNL